MAGTKEKLDLIAKVDAWTKEMQAKTEKFSFEIKKINDRIEEVRKNVTGQSQEWVEEQINKAKTWIDEQTKEMSEWMQEQNERINKYKEAKMKEIQDAISLKQKEFEEVTQAEVERQAKMKAIQPGQAPEKKKKRTQAEKDADEAAEAARKQAEEEKTKAVIRKQALDNFHKNYVCFLKDYEGGKYLDTGRWLNANTALKEIQKTTGMTSLTVDDIINKEKDLSDVGLKRVALDSILFEEGEIFATGELAQKSQDELSQLVIPYVQEVDKDKFAQAIYRGMYAQMANCINADISYFKSGPKFYAFRATYPKA